MPRQPVAPTTPAASPATTAPTKPQPADVSEEGMLDLDDNDQINNQHLEVR